VAPIDHHALAPIEILGVTILLVLVVDLFLPMRAKAASMWVSSSAARTWSTRSP
jgi:hypothetical protein